MKLADLIPGYKNDDSNSKKDYRPISVLPAVSKVYERVLKDQISSYLHTILCNILCGFRAGYSTQQALIRWLEKWKKFLDRTALVGKILIGMSKAYDCLPDDLLKAKLRTYALDVSSLRLLHSSLNNHYQRTKISSHRSTGKKNQHWGPTRIGTRPSTF